MADGGGQGVGSVARGHGGEGEEPVPCAAPRAWRRAAADDGELVARARFEDRKAAAAAAARPPRAPPDTSAERALAATNTCSTTARGRVVGDHLAERPVQGGETQGPVRPGAAPRAGRRGGSGRRRAPPRRSPSHSSRDRSEDAHRASPEELRGHSARGRGRGLAGSSEPRHLRFRDVEVRIHGLDVVQVVEARRCAASSPPPRPRSSRCCSLHDTSAAEALKPAPRARAHGVELARGRHHLDGLLPLHHVAGARLRRPRAGVAAPGSKLRTPRFSKGTRRSPRSRGCRCTGEHVADLAHGAVAVSVRARSRIAVRPVRSPRNHLLEGFASPPPTPSDRSLDVVLGHVGGPALSITRRAGVALGLPPDRAAVAISRQLGEDLAALGVDGALLAPDRRHLEWPDMEHGLARRDRPANVRVPKAVFFRPVRASGSRPFCR